MTSPVAVNKTGRSGYGFGCGLASRGPAVPVPRRPVGHLESVIGAPRYARLLAAAAEFRRRLGGRRIWNVNSTAVGGGVAEMLQTLVGYVRDLDIPIEWAVIGG